MKRFFSILISAALVLIVLVSCDETTVYITNKDGAQVLAVTQHNGNAEGGVLEDDVYPDLNDIFTSPLFNDVVSDVVTADVSNVVSDIVSTTVKVPNVVGLTYYDAEAVLTALGIRVGNIHGNNTVTEDSIVIKQTPNAGYYINVAANKVDLFFE